MKDYTDIERSLKHSRFDKAHRDGSAAFASLPEARSTKHGAGSSDQWSVISDQLQYAAGEEKALKGHNILARGNALGSGKPEVGSQKSEVGSRKGKGTLANPAGIRFEANRAWIAGPAVGGPSLPGFVPSCCTGNEKSVTGREISVQDAKISCRDAKKSYRTGDFVTGSTQNGTGPAAAGDWGILKDELATARFHRVGLRLFDIPPHRCKRGTPLLMEGKRSCAETYSVFQNMEMEYGHFSSSKRRRNDRASNDVRNKKEETLFATSSSQPQREVGIFATLQLAAQKKLALDQLVTRGSCLVTLQKLTKKYDNPPSRRVTGTTKNAHLSAMEFMGTGDNNLNLFLATARLYRVDNNKPGVNRPHDTIVRQHQEERWSGFAKRSEMRIFTDKRQAPPSLPEGEEKSPFGGFRGSVYNMILLVRFLVKTTVVRSAEGFRTVANNSKNQLAYET